LLSARRVSRSKMPQCRVHMSSKTKRGTILNRNIAACVLVLAAGAASAAEVPFLATHDVPDYSASMSGWRDYSKSQTYSRSVVHHNGLTRVEETYDDGTWIFYGNFFDNVLLQAQKSSAGDFISVRLSKTAPSHDYLSVKGSRQTAETDSQAGERCRWWEIVRQPHRIRCADPSGSVVCPMMASKSAQRY
jgi:hypothetical protein